jgi:ABC-2 type transport system permease protein
VLRPGPILTLVRRELAADFASPVAYVFITVFLVLSATLTFHLGAFFERGRADLQPFFQFHPWLYLVLIPALGMRLWAEERRSGTLEFLLSLPISVGEAVLAKFLAAWLFAGVALVLTWPMWALVAYLGAPDHGAILAGYLGSWLMAGGYLAVAGCLSAITRSQVIAFVLAALVCVVLTGAGSAAVQGALPDWAPESLLAAVRALSFLTNFQAIQQGLLELRDLVFFAALIVAGLIVNTALIELGRGR